MPAVVVFIILPVVVLATVSIARWRDGRPPSLSRSGSSQVSAPGARPALEFSDVPRSYDITYRVERYDERDVRVSEDRIRVDRPFRSRVTGRSRDRVVAERVSRLGTLVITTGEGNRSFVSPPTLASGDLRFDTVLPEAVAEKLVQVRERRRVSGRECQVYRLGGPVQAGELVPVGAKRGQRADVCVDAAGLLLEEVWVQDGRPLQRRVATAVTVPSPARPSLFTLPAEQEVSFEAGNGFIRALDPGSGFNGTTYRLPADAVVGYRYVGRFAVQPPRLSPFGTNPLEADRPREQVSQVDVWERGPDTLILTQVIAADIAALPSNPSVAQEIDLGPVLGQGRAVLDLRLNDVRVEATDGYFVRLSGSLARPELVRLARSIVAEETTGIRLLDGS